MRKLNDIAQYRITSEEIKCGRLRWKIDELEEKVKKLRRVHDTARELCERLGDRNYYGTSYVEILDKLREALAEVEDE